LPRKMYRRDIFVGFSYPRRCTNDRSFAGSQLALAKKYHLPLFLHSRAAHTDFVEILQEEGFGTDGGRAHGARGGVVHSFTGSIPQAVEYQEMGFYLRFVRTSALPACAMLITPLNKREWLLLKDRR
jgi:Tat protein secretion system quality control protein TatD with DNase activity